MTCTRFTLLNDARWIYGIAAFFMLMPGVVFATHFEVSRLASEIEFVSSQLAYDLRHSRNYGSVRQRANSLSKEAAQLVETVTRNRSNSRIRSQFKRLRRDYEHLQEAFLRANRKDHRPHLYAEINVLSNLFSNLSNTFYYADIGGQNSPSVYIGSRNYTNRPHSGRAIVRQHERESPPVFRGHNMRPNVNRQANRANTDRGRVDHDSRTARRGSSFDHSSKVLNRKSRQNATRHQLEERARHNRSPALRGPYSRSESGRSARSGRGNSTETGRRNHYE